MNSEEAKKRAERETEDTNARNDKMREIGEPVSEERLRALIDRVVGAEGPRDAFEHKIERASYLNELAFAVERMLLAGTGFRGQSRRERAARALAFVHAAEAVARTRFGIELREHVTAPESTEEGDEG